MTITVDIIEDPEAADDISITFESITTLPLSKDMTLETAMTLADKLDAAIQDLLNTNNDLGSIFAPSRQNDGEPISAERMIAQ